MLLRSVCVPSLLPSHSQLHRTSRIVIAILLLCCLPVLLCCSSLAGSRTAPPDDAQARTAKAFEAARRQGPLALRAFLAAMPKGADLHSHLGGAVYAESMIAQAAADGLCLSLADLRLLKADGKTPTPVCGKDEVPAGTALRDQHLYDALVDAMSMRSFVPSAGRSGHDQFFDSFKRFEALGTRHIGEWLAEVSARAAAQNVPYLELMVTPPFEHAARLAQDLGWNPDLAAFRRQLLERGLKDELGAGRQLLNQALAGRDRQQHCGSARAAPGCAVKINFLYQVLRGAAPERVFAQTLLGFEMAAVDPRWVGINFVMPEDGYLSMRDYSLQMRMLDFLHRQYPQVHISLHAGELAPGLVPPEGLRFHIREAVELGHAERIGHGVSVMYEDRPQQLLEALAARGVMIEINLTSNDRILGIKGKDHPLPFYLRHGVPVALSTDDEGVSRIDLTHEYVRAALDFELGYDTLKQMARNSLGYSFLPGASLWSSQACDGQTHPDTGCSAFLAGSEKAAMQWELERRFRAFEASH